MSSAATVEVRRAVEAALADVEPGDLVLVACSGGPDSLALAAATAWCAERSAVRAGSVTIDHALQADSAAVAERAAKQCRDLGLDPVVVCRVDVADAGGPEMAARIARYTALDDVAHDLGAVAVLLGHTRDDQAETVLLRLARGSGARTLSGMAERDGLWRRPLLGLGRGTVAEAADEAGSPWRDPHNDDPRYARVRVRRLLGDLEDALGSGVVAGLARSADLLRDDADALDAWADAVSTVLVSDDDGGVSVGAEVLEGLPRAVRTRIIRRMCLSAGSPADDLTMAHVQTVERLISDWRGQGDINLPGGVTASRAYGRLSVTSR